MNRYSSSGEVAGVKARDSVRNMYAPEILSDEAEEACMAEMPDNYYELSESEQNDALSICKVGLLTSVARLVEFKQA